MGLVKNRIKNVRSTKIKLSKKSALKFKRSASKPRAIDMKAVQEHIEKMEVENADDGAVSNASKKLTKKQVLRQMRKDEMRKCLAAKRLKSRLNSSNAMEGASLDEQTVESTKTVTTKINNDRIKKDALPINPPPNKKQLKIRAKELAASNVVSGRRMSKKKARKIINAIKRDEREKERNEAKMDI